jgi:hypothetical protein
MGEGKELGVGLGFLAPLPQKEKTEAVPPTEDEVAAAAAVTKGCGWVSGVGGIGMERWRENEVRWE